MGISLLIVYKVKSRARNQILATNTIKMEVIAIVERNSTQKTS